jgi:RND superfamily putative drug exporter
LIPLFSALIALTTAGAIVYYLAKADLVTLNGQSQGILFVLVIGAATDYALLMISRYREELHHFSEPWGAIKAAWRGTFEPILASGSTASLGLLVLLASELNSNKSTGPVAAVGIASAMLVMLALLPALLVVPSVSLPLLAAVLILAVGFGLSQFTDLELSSVFPVAGGAAGLVAIAVIIGGVTRLMKKPPNWAWWVKIPAARWVFWPKVPEFDDVDPKLMGIWATVARAVGTRPRWAWVLSTLVLVGAGAFAFQLNNDGIDQTEALISRPDSVIGQEELAKHFPAGAGSPTIIIAPEGSAEQVREVALSVDGVEDVQLRRVAPVIPGQPEPPVRVEDGLVLLEATTSGAADSVESRAAIPLLRDAVRGVTPEALVGGFTAVGYDTQQASTRDRNLIIPVVLLVILVILILLLRSIVAPLLLLATVVLSFLATLGVSYLVFNYLFAEWFDAPGFLKADASFPLFAFVFLVALGIDYNIFLMTRVREETLKLGTRPGILKGLTVTGGVITSAGIVLSATFAVLGVLPLVFLAQIGFAVSFGVLLDTFLVRSILVPALSYDIGQKIWWPSKLAFVKQPKVTRAPYEPKKALTSKR